MMSLVYLMRGLPVTVALCYAMNMNAEMLLDLTDIAYVPSENRYKTSLMHSSHQRDRVSRHAALTVKK